MPSPTGTIRKARFGPYELDFRAGELRKNGYRIRLQDQPLQVLALLLEHPSEVVTREELRQRLWPTDTFVDFDHGLNNAINRLRDALNDSADAPRFIETLPRRGYRFLAEVRNEAPSVPSTIAASSSENRVNELGVKTVVTISADDATHSVARQDRPKKAWFAAAGAGFGALLLGLAFVWRASLSHAAPVHIQSIAVLPFENLSSNSEQDYLADGMTEALTTELARLSALRVVSRTSTKVYRGTKKSLPEVAKELQVDAIVEGAVIRSGDRVRIDAQLILAGTDRHLWAKGYERKLDDVVALQSELAQAIADEIHIRVTPEERARLAAVPSVNAEAYEAYLKGRFLWNERTEKGISRAVDFFEEAIAKDPGYAPAYSGLADSYSLLGFYGVLPPKEAYSRAQTAATKALQIDPSLAEAHVSRAEAVCALEWNWPEAESELKRAIELNSNYDTAYRKYSNYLIGMGRSDEAIAAAKKALELDHLSITLGTHLAWIQYLARNYDLAAAQYEKTLDLSPNYARAHRDFALTLAEEGRYEDALREIQKGIEFSDRSPLMLKVLGYVYAKSGKKREARNVLRELREMSRTRYVSPFDLAVVHAALGEKDAAFSYLEKACDDRAGQLIWLNVHPLLDSLRRDPRFANLVSRVGLPKAEPANLSATSAEHSQ